MYVIVGCTPRLTPLVWPHVTPETICVRRASIGCGSANRPINRTIPRCQSERGVRHEVVCHATRRRCARGCAHRAFEWTTPCRRACLAAWNMGRAGLLQTAPLMLSVQRSRVHVVTMLWGSHLARRTRSCCSCGPGPSAWSASGGVGVHALSHAS